MEKDYNYYVGIVKKWVEKDLRYATETVDGKPVRISYAHWRRLRKNLIDGFRSPSKAEKEKLKALYVDLMEEKLPPVVIPTAPKRPRIVVSTF